MFKSVNVALGGKTSKPTEQLAQGKEVEAINSFDSKEQVAFDLQNVFAVK